MPEIITNKTGMSRCWVDAAINDDYSKGDADYSVTGVLAPAQVVALCSRHEYKVDVTEMVWSILGNAVHSLLERMGGREKGVFNEQRHFYKIKVGDKTFVVSGAVDRCEPTDEGYHLKDFKISKVWTAKHGLKDEWKHQTNIYRLFVEKKGLKVNQISIEMLCKDWEIRDLMIARKKGDYYPENQVHVFDVPFMTNDEVDALLRERIEIHEAVKVLPDSQLPECSEEERWCRDSRYIVRKETSDRALPKAGNFDSMAEAEEWRTNRKDKGEGCVAEFRQGTSVRCERFCHVSHLCHQYRTKINPKF